jgi:hypothetical protein
MFKSLASILVSGWCLASPNVQAADWPTHNRSIAQQGLQTQQNYREIDTSGQTVDGNFNSERGHWQGTRLQLRWQGHAGPVPLWLQTQTNRSSGQTDYQGYLQSGSQLTPYQARTGNTVQQHSLRLGWPVDVAALWPNSATVPQLQIVPYVDWAHQRWQRNPHEFER